MSLPIPFSFLRRQWLPVTALVVGAVLGRGIRQMNRGDQSPQGGVQVEAASAPAVVPNGSEPLAAGAQDASDSAVEAEVARLLGGMSSAAGTRTPLQTMDAISAAYAEKSDLRRFLGIYEAVSELGKDDIAEALARARTEDNAIAVRALERRWAEVDPLGAVKAWTDGNGKPPGDAFFTAWAKSNPTSALRWFSSLEDGDFKNQTRTLILERVAKTDPQRALDYANQMPQGQDQNQLVARALAVMGVKDSDEALAAANRLPEGSSRKAGLDSVVGQIAATNLDEAKKLIAELPPNTVSGAANMIAIGLVRQDVGKAFEWANGLPEGQSKDSAYGGIAREWAARDVVAAAGWLDTLPKGTARDAAVASFANRTAPRDPEGATLWASTLPPGEQRTSTLEQTVGIWRRTNPAAAAEWINTAPGLTADERTALLQGQSQRSDSEKNRPSRRQRAGN